MKTCLLSLAIAASVLFSFNVCATVRYVNLNCTNPASPYVSWATAATNIQDAITPAVTGDLIWVTNGVYQAGGTVVYGAMTNRVAVTKVVTVESVNGPAVTVIRGNSPLGTNAVRCVYLTSGATLSGFTLTNGATRYTGDATAETSGGGVLCGSIGSVVSNCVIVGNSAISGGGAEGGTLINCTILRNSANCGGGACGDGNGASEIGTVSNLLVGCIIATNWASDHGGGAIYSTLNSCVLSSNCVHFYTGGGASYSALINCLIITNAAPGYYGGGAGFSTLTNCTLVGNSAMWGGGAGDSALQNCILYYNVSGGNFSDDNLSYCCTTPLPPGPPGGAGNITNDPAFVNPAGGDFHLQSNSPCINSGNNACVTTSTDLDGNPRIVGGTVDIGAYEYQTPTSVISYAWLQQYGLPTDGSVDYADLDGTAFNVYQDWIAGLNPTNPASVLALLMPVSTNNPAGLVVSWQSVSNRTYFLQSSTNLGAQPAFQTVATNIAGQAPTTSYTDTNAVGSGPYFYRVGVQE
jgi:hypothetical protein